MLFKVLQPEESHFNYTCYTHGLSSHSYILQRTVVLLYCFILLSTSTAKAIKLNFCKTEKMTNTG